MLTDPYGTSPTTKAINFNVETLTEGGVRRVVNAKYRAHNALKK